VDWERSRFRVDSPKTGERWIPIFPELRPHLEECFELAQEGAVHVINRYRDTNANLRTTFTKIIRRAGEKPWPKLFHNLRASRETELAADYPIHVVCEWIGNTAAIAAKHYLTVRDEDYERATKGGAKTGAPEAQFPAQQSDAGNGVVTQDSSEVLEGCDSTPLLACRNSLQQNDLVPPRGHWLLLNCPAQNPLLPSSLGKASFARQGQLAKKSDTKSDTLDPVRGEECNPSLCKSPTPNSKPDGNDALQPKE
jgi:hypothetical protein